MLSNGIKWVVMGRDADGNVYRGVQVARLGHPAMEFFSKRIGVKFVASSAEKKTHFDRFLAEGKRQPLTEEELSR